MHAVRESDACSRTGLTPRQLRYRRERGQIRWCRLGRYPVYHPEDIAALESMIWQGNPVTTEE